MRQLLPFFCLLALALPARAQFSLNNYRLNNYALGVAAGGGGGGGGCATVLTNRLNDTTGGGANLGDFSTDTNATFFIPANSGTICTLVFKVGKVGSPTFNFNATLMSDSGGFPNTVLAGSPDTIAASSISSTDPSESTISFTIAPTAVTAGTKYWPTLKTDGTGGASNFVKWYYSGAFAGGQTVHYNGGTWNHDLVGFLCKIEALGP